VVDDYEQWRRYFSATLQKRPESQVISEASDGFEAVQKAQQLQPDLILLDIGLPTVNGIEAARRIREVSPTSKILFVSENRSLDIVEKALSTGAGGYVLKSDAKSELLPALKAVLEGKRFVSSSLAGFHAELADLVSEEAVNRDTTVAPALNSRTALHHEVGFYSDDRQLVDALTRFVVAALKVGNAAIVVATQSHRDSLLSRLEGHDLDVAAAVQQGRYIALDAADALSTFMVDGLPDHVRFLETFEGLIQAAAGAAKQENPRVAFFGECVHLLWQQGNPEAAVQLEQLCNRLAKKYDLDILCGYSLGSVMGRMDDHIFQRICAEHSAVFGR